MNILSSYSLYGIESVCGFSGFVFNRFACASVCDEKVEEFIDDADLLGAAIDVAGILGYSHVYTTALQVSCEVAVNFFKLRSFFSSFTTPLNKLLEAGWALYSKPTSFCVIPTVNGVCGTAHNGAEYVRKFSRDTLAVLSLLKLPGFSLAGYSLKVLDFKQAKSWAEFISPVTLFGTANRPEDGFVPLTEAQRTDKARLKGIAKKWELVTKVSYLALGIIGVLSLVPSVVALLPTIPAAALMSLGQLSMVYMPAYVPLVINAPLTVPGLYLTACLSQLFTKYVKNCYPQPDSLGSSGTMRVIGSGPKLS